MKVMVNLHSTLFLISISEFLTGLFSFFGGVCIITTFGEGETGSAEGATVQGITEPNEMPDLSQMIQVRSL